MEKNIVFIDGLAFDADTGKRIVTNSGEASTATKPNSQQSTAWHSQTVNYRNYANSSRLQKAQTLNRDFVSKPAIEAKPQPVAVNHFNRPKAQVKAAEISKRTAHAHPMIGHFKPGDFNPTKQPIVISEKQLPDEIMSAEELAKYKERLSAARKTAIKNRIRISRIQRQRQHNKVRLETPQALMTNQDQARQLLQQTSPEQSLDQTSLKQELAKDSNELKNRLINQALANAKPVETQTKQKTKKRRRLGRSQLVSFSAASLAIVLLIGYLTYLNIPQLSLRVAANQAGVEATYPNYQPVGYSLTAPAKADGSQVAMTFAKSGENFTISEQATNWNSEALLSQIVIPDSNDNFSTHNQNGLTLYNFANKTVWVNRGILYTIENNSTLSSEEIRQLAISL